MNRIKRIKEFRLASSAKPTRDFAERPYQFFSSPQELNKNYLVVPRVSSERRKYIPIGFLGKNEIAADSVSIVHLGNNNGLYEFGIIESAVHMAWMRIVAGRLKSDYRYSGAVVYNNFVWPSVSQELKQAIELSAQGILDARANHPDLSLADLYDDLTMPTDLRKAHKANDRAVMKAYGFKSSMPESEIVAELFKLYQKKVDELAEAEAAQKATKKPRKRKTAATAPAEPE